MSFGVNFFLITSLVLFLLCLISMYYCVRFGLIILRLEDILDQSLDDLDKCYRNMTEIASTPIFFDSIEVRKCIEEINKSRYTLVSIANKLASLSKNYNEEIKIENKQDGQEANS